VWFVYIFSEVSHALQQFVFECMRLTSVDDIGAFSTAAFDRQLDIPWDDPYPYYTGMMLSELPEDDPMRCTNDGVPNEVEPLPPLVKEVKPGKSVLQSPFCTCFLTINKVYLQLG